jgi:hypothetical protein
MYGFAPSSNNFVYCLYIHLLPTLQHILTSFCLILPPAVLPKYPTSDFLASNHNSFTQVHPVQSSNQGLYLSYCRSAVPSPLLKIHVTSYNNSRKSNKSFPIPILSIPSSNICTTSKVKYIKMSRGWDTSNTGRRITTRNTNKPNLHKEYIRLIFQTIPLVTNSRGLNFRQIHVS